MEYVIWGIPPGSDDEQVLFSHQCGQPITDRQIAEACERLAVRRGATAVRIQSVDMADGRIGFERS